MKGLRRLGIGLVVAGFVGFFALQYGNELFIALEGDEKSQSIGTPSNGSMIAGKRMPTQGDNFQAYSKLGALLGRNAMHHAVRDLLLAAYAQLAKSHPDTIFVYGESAWPWGGSFRPHRTHKNGLSVDFMVPVRDSLKTSVPLPCPVHLKFGYGIEFDNLGKWRDLTIDFEALALHLQALQHLAPKYGLRIGRVIFDPQLQPKLLGTIPGRKVRRSLTFSKNQAWVRHDEHYHIDFELVK